MFRYIQFFLLCIFLPTGDSACDQGWMAYKDELCIKIFSELSSYDDAKSYCSSHTASLVMVKEEELQQLIGNYTDGIFDYVWLGSRYNNTTSLFEWEDGEQLTYTNWQDGYPRNITDPNTCIELRPTESISTKKVQGKWAHSTCQKRNLVMCQKTFSWSLQDAVKEIIELRKQLQEEQKERIKEITDLKTQLEGVNAKVIPVGSIYVEYNGQPSPQTLWPNLTWQDISSTYAGLFFRALGGQSEGWGVSQSECAPRITQFEYTERTMSSYPNSMKIPSNGWSEFGAAGRIDYRSTAWFDEGLRFFSADCEVRPRNQAIRIWKRTA